ncbi:MAG: hydrogenase maturation protease [Magnetococcus sp. DMHC-1]
MREPGIDKGSGHERNLESTTGQDMNETWNRRQARKGEVQMLQKESSIQVLVLGIGNVNQGDAGAGVRTVEILQRNFQIPPGVQISDGASMEQDLDGAISQAKHVILVNAFNAGAEPGSLLKLVGREIPDFINHQNALNPDGLPSILSQPCITEKRPETMTLYGIEPTELAMGLELSGEVAPQTERLACHLAEELERLGFSVPPRGLLSAG